MKQEKIWAERLKWLRDTNRYSQREIASEIQMTLNGYQKIEYGDRDPKLDVIIKLALFYNESTDFLLGLTDLTHKLKQISNALENEKAEISMQKRMIQENTLEDREMNEILVTRHRNLVTNYHYRLLNYLKLFVEVPFANPKNDRHLKDVFPVDFKINENIDRSMSVKLITKTGLDLGELEEVHIPDNFEEQIEKVETVIEMYNSKFNIFKT